MAGRWLGWWGQATWQEILPVGACVAVLAGTALIAVYLFTRRPRATKFAILVAALDGDANQTQTRHILQSLRMQFAEAIERRDLQVLSRGEALRSSAGDIQDTDIALQKRGRA